MATSYPALFVDKNGETRIAGTLTFTANEPTFNGGTITQPLDILMPATGVTPLSILTTNLNVFAADVSAASFYIAVESNIDSRQIFLLGPASDVLYVQNSAGTEALYVRDDTYTELRPVVIQTAAPADAALSAGQLAMWYDDTNGAGKLMFKAKQADGAVKTGSVAVNT